MLAEDRNVTVDHGATTSGIDEGNVLADGVLRFGLEPPPVRPARNADVVRHHQRRDLVGLGRVMECRKCGTRTRGKVDHPRHVVGAVAMDVDWHLAGENHGEGLLLEVVAWRAVMAVMWSLAAPRDAIPEPPRKPRASQRSHPDDC